MTLFEFLTGMAFYSFDQAGADVQTIEVGLGGRLDATNVVDADVCVITSVSMDHANILGDTIEKIASEKAGIIKPGSIPVIAPQRPEALQAILEACNLQDVEPALVGRDVTWEPHGSYMGGQHLTVHGLLGSYDLDIPLVGDYQRENAASAVAAVESLGMAQGLDISPEALANGFRSVSWPCRMELLSRDPVVVSDGAHNDYSVERLLESLPRYFEYDPAGSHSRIFQGQEHRRYGQLTGPRSRLRNRDPGPASPCPGLGGTRRYACESGEPQPQKPPHPVRRWSWPDAKLAPAVWYLPRDRCFWRRK